MRKERLMDQVHEWNDDEEHSPHFLFEDHDLEDFDDDDDDGRKEDEEIDGGGSGGGGGDGRRSARMPTEAQLVLLCLDHLRDLRRSYDVNDIDDDGDVGRYAGRQHPLRIAEGLDPDCIALAAWALSRAFVGPPASSLRHASSPSTTVEGDEGGGMRGRRARGNDPSVLRRAAGAASNDDDGGDDGDVVDANTDVRREQRRTTATALLAPSSRRTSFALSRRIALPTMEEITNEVLLRHHITMETGMSGTGNPVKEDGRTPNLRSRNVKGRDADDGEANDDECDESDGDDVDGTTARYEIDDEHPSNMHRFYLLEGLASSSSCEAIAAELRGTGGGPVSPTHRASSGTGGGAGGGRGGGRGLVTPRGFFFQTAASAAPGSTIAEADVILRRNGHPLTLVEIAYAGLVGLRARTRLDATRSMVGSELFHQFVSAASVGGFFKEKMDRGGEESMTVIAAGDGEDAARRSSRKTYEEKYRKVVDKFQTKLAVKEALYQSSMLARHRNQHPSQQYVGVHSPDNRLSNAYRIMSGNNSVSSASRSNGAPPVGAFSMISINDVAERRHRWRTRRIENANKKWKRIGGDTGGVQDYHPFDNGSNDDEGDQPVTEEEPILPSLVDAIPLKDCNLSDEMTRGVGDVTEVGAAAGVVNLPHYQEAERLNVLGNSLMQQKLFQNALDAYTLALNLTPAGPKSHVFYSNRSAAYLSLNMNNHSIRDCERSIALIKSRDGGGGVEYYAKAHSRLGLAYFACGRYREAVDAYEKSLETEPNNQWTLDHLEKAKARIMPSIRGGEGGYVMNESKTIAVIAVPEESAEAGGGEGGGGTTNEEEVSADKIQQADDHKNKGNVQMSRKQYKEAVNEYTLAIEVSPAGPNSYVYYSNRAAAHCYLANYVNAANDCQRSIELNPTYEKAYSRLGLSLFLQGDYEGSILAYESSLKLDPTNAASLSYWKKAKARLAEQHDEKKAIEERKKKSREEQYKARKREEKSQQQHQQGQVVMADNEDDDRDSVITGLTSIVTNDVIHSP